MDKKTSMVITVLLVISLLANILLLVLIMSNKTGNYDVTGFSARAKQETPLLENDIIEIKKDELLKCCSFININGEEDGCYVLRGYDCGYCSDYCD